MDHGTTETNVQSVLACIHHKEILVLKNQQDTDDTPNSSVLIVGKRIYILQIKNAFFNWVTSD